MMLLEKIKKHGLKVLFFATNVLLIAAGVVFIKQRNAEDTNVAKMEDEAQKYESTVADTLDVQAPISADENVKINSIDKPLENVVVTANTVQSQDQKSIPVAAPVPAPVVKISGKCGSADSSKDRKNSNCNGTAPKSGLCSAGVASAITFKPNKHDQGWNWTCNGQNGGSSATCRCS